MAKFQFELSESGDGPAMLMLPGSYATPAAWKGILGNLTRSFRLFSTSLPGYGSTPEVRSAGNSHIDLMTRICRSSGRQGDRQRWVSQFTWWGIPGVRIWLWLHRCGDVLHREACSALKPTRYLPNRLKGHFSGAWMLRK